MPRNHIIRCRCNIGTYTHLLFTKAPSSEFQECSVKLLYPLYFIRVHTIFILICNEWFGWLHTIWICNRKTLLLSFHDCFFPHPSSIVWLIWSCHLLCLGFSFFFQSDDPITPLHVAYCWYVVRTKCYQDLRLVTCQVNSWWRFFIARGCSSLWLTRNSLPIITYSWCHMHFTFSITYFKLFQYVTVDGCYVNWTNWNNFLIILF